MPGDSPFEAMFLALAGSRPFPWQGELHRRLVAGDWDRLTSCDIPTGLGKTAVIPIWLIALASRAGRVPRRLVYVVNRRTVVDQATEEAVKIRRRLLDPDEGSPTAEVGEARRRLDASLRGLSGGRGAGPLAISTLRGQFADNREWSADPARPAVIVGTVDMIGSRLLFGGYGLGFKARPLHAGFLGQDALLVHDEAHLEPAFQALVEAIRDEQRGEPAPLGEGKRLRVMALTATSRGGEALRLADEDRADAEVGKRIGARKSLHLHGYDDEKKLPALLAGLALAHRDSGRAVLVFARTVEAVEGVVERLRKEGQAVVALTGTLRGKERDALVREDPVFRRFLPGAGPGGGTAYLVCTSAGEVGVNISADHLACDLSTYESMAQRFGRVNRFGDRGDTRIDILYPTAFGGGEIDARRAKTLALLRRLDGDGSPAALAALPADERRAAFGPDPEIVPTSDILFDAWALTSVRGELPGRPPVAPYLHGRPADWEPPVTHVAWREEVGVIGPELLDRHELRDLLEAFPLKPHELLKDRSDRVSKHLDAIAGRHPGSRAWLIRDDGTIEVLSLDELTGKEGKGRIEGRTVLLSPAAGGLEGGLLKGGSEAAVDDVADDWLDEDGGQRRERRWDEATPAGMRLILALDTASPDAEEQAAGDARAVAPRRFWRWYVRPRSSDDDMSRTARDAVAWEVHVGDVTRALESILRTLELPDDVKVALIIAAMLHDHGKRRPAWQRSIGNPDPTRWLAKSGRAGGRGRAINIELDYRHEFGSLLDAAAESCFKSLDDERRDLVLHLVATHHGRGRPHFEPDEAFDPGHPRDAAERMAAEVPRRYARLQRRYGRWGLAYLESLLRAADYAASAEPSATLEGGR